MRHFLQAHATHPHWPMAAALVLAQLRAQLAAAAPADPAGHGGAAGRLEAGQTVTPLGLLYLTDHYADAAADLSNLRFVASNRGRFHPLVPVIDGRSQ